MERNDCNTGSCPVHRDFKFRCYDETDSGYVGYGCGPASVYKFDLDLVHRVTQWLRRVEHKFIVEQYTGLRGKNGREIYEGDIVSWLDGLREKHIFRVEWQGNRARFCLRNQQSDYDYEDLCDKKAPYLEIIGNIHENSELLKSECRVEAFRSPDTEFAPAFTNPRGIPIPPDEAKRLFSREEG